MCRLSAFTTTNIDPVMKRLFWNQLMLVSNADGQSDGAGMTDGKTAMKSGWTYFDYGQEWVQHLTPGAAWLGHVRSASRSTESGSRAAHPYRFGVGNASLYAAHNGFITDTKDIPLQAFEPRVDSYRAFTLLAAAMKPGDAITPELVNAWTAKFGEGSEWTMMLHYQDAVHVLVGNRPMHYMSFDNGFMFNTSAVVLTTFKTWILTYWQDRFKVGKITPMKQHTMARLHPGVSTFEVFDINPSPVAPYIDKWYRDDTLMTR